MMRGVKGAEFRVRSFRAERFLKNGLFLFGAGLLLVFCLQSFALGDEKWAGIDDSVVKKIAKEHGREAKEPLINTDQGDLLLFVFLLAGVVGGFAAGYYWRILMVENTLKNRRTQEEIKS
jgi:cobalt/nickel transport protein